MLLHRRGLLRAGLALGGTSLSGAPLRAWADGATLTQDNGQHRATTEALVGAFTGATGIRVVARHAESPELASQIVEEGARSPADVFYSEQSPPVASLQEKGLLAPIDAATLKLTEPRFEALDGTWIGASVRTRVLTYNRRMTAPADLPKSILDIATPAMAGRIAYVKGDGFQEQVMAIVHIHGSAVALEWLRGLAKYGRSYNGNRIASTAVENGEVAMALSNNYYWYSLAREKGAENLSSALYSFPGKDAGNIYNVSAAGILKSSRNAAAAQAFLRFMLGHEGQAAMAATSAEYPVIAGVASPFPLAPLSLAAAEVTPADMGSASDAYALMRQAGLI